VRTRGCDLGIVNKSRRPNNASNHAATIPMPMSPVRTVDEKGTTASRVCEKMSKSSEHTNAPIGTVTKSDGTVTVGPAITERGSLAVPKPAVFPRLESWHSSLPAPLAME
jgi:hypothetical protein